MVQKIYFTYTLLCVTVLSMTSGLTLPKQVTSKPHHIKTTPATTEAGSGSQGTPSNDKNDDVGEYRHINSKTGKTCTLLKTDALVEVKYIMYNLEEQQDSLIPDNVLVDGNCDTDTSSMSISWIDYNLLFNFAKTPGHDKWYLTKIELTVNPDLKKFHNIKGKLIKLYNTEQLMPTSIGKHYSCEDMTINLETDEDDHPPPGLRGSLILRRLQLQPFMDKEENFGAPSICRPQESYRDETAPIAAGSTLAVIVLMTITGYGVFRYFKVKNLQYNTME